MSAPGSGWADRSCAAWVTGGDLTTGTQTWAALGVQLASGSPYDVGAYSGLTLNIETGARVMVIVKTLSGGYFGQYIEATSGTEARSVSFASMFAMENSAVSTLDLSEVTELQFAPERAAGGFGFAIHSLFLAN